MLGFRLPRLSFKKSKTCAGKTSPELLLHELRTLLSPNTSVLHSPLDIASFRIRFIRNVWVQVIRLKYFLPTTDQ